MSHFPVLLLITVAALMHPLQYDLRSLAAKYKSITYAAAAPSNLDAAIPMRSAETQLQNTIELRATASETAAPKPDGSRRQSEKKTILKHFLKGFLKGKSLAPKWRKSANKSTSQPGCSHSNTIYDFQLQKTIILRMQLRHHATFMQPFQCDLQKQTQETHRTTYTGTSSVTKHIEGTKRPQPHPPHRRGTFHRCLQPLYTEKHKVSCSGFLPTTKPMQHSCSHSNAICKHKLKKRIELRTQDHPVLQNTLKERNDPSRTRRTDKVPFIVACSHFTRKNTRFRAPASSPQQSPCNIHAAIPMRSANTNSRNA